MNTRDKFWTIVLSLTIALPFTLAAAFSSVARIQAGEVNSNEASAIPANLDCDGVVTLNPNGATGNYTSTPTITRSPDTNSTPAAELMVNPTLNGGEIDNRIQPTQDQPSDTRNLECNYRDAGDTKVNFDLFVEFSAISGKDYRITWNNKEFAATWKGLIDLPQAESSAHANFAPTPTTLGHRPEFPGQKSRCMSPAVEHRILKRNGLTMSSDETQRLLAKTVASRISKTLTFRVTRPGFQRHLFTKHKQPPQ